MHPQRNIRKCRECSSPIPDERNGQFCSEQCRIDRAARSFWDKVDKSGECWIWTASCFGSGYGQAYTGRDDARIVGAHRMSYELSFGPIADGMYVLHKCDNRKCVNPDHLFLGDQARNMNDAAEKGRIQRGVRHWNSKLNPQIVRRIRKMYDAGMSYQEIGDIVGLRPQYVGSICRRRRWAWVK